MFKSSKKKLIAIGDSFTDDAWLTCRMGEEYNFTVWPTLLAEKLGMECVNLGKSGMGQEYMVAKLLDILISEKNIGLVVIMWSEWQRIDFETQPSRWYSLHPHRNQNKENEKFPMNLEGRKTLLKYYNTVASTMKNLRQFLISQEMIKDIPYLMIQGPSALLIEEPFSYPLYLNPESNLCDPIWQNALEVVKKNRKTAIQQTINSSIGDRINEDNFIGWPIWPEVGGYDVSNMLDKIDPERTRLRISYSDSHPNEEGHKIISQKIYDTYARIYL